MASILKHLRSSTANKRPTASGLADGQIAINTASGTPALFFKDNASNIVKVGPAHVGSTAPNTSPAGSAGNSTGELWVDNGLTTNGLKYYNGTAFVNLTPSGTTSTIGLVELATDAETQAGTDAARAVTPSGLQSKISDSTSTSSSTTIASSTAVKSAYDLANAALPKAGGTITGAVTISPSGSLSFEGSTDDSFETTLAVVDPTADRTITLPNVTGTVVTTGDSGTVTSTMIANDTIVDANINSAAAITLTKLGTGALPTTITVASGNIVDGTISNVEISASAAIADTKLDTISTADKVSLSALNIDGGTDIGAALADADLFIVDDGGGGTNRKAAATRITDYAFGKVSGDITIGSTGTAAISSGVIVNADVNASAAIAGTKISPDFGSQTVQTTGIFSAALGAAATPSIAFTGDTNTGIYSPGADQVAISTNGTGRLFVASTGGVGVGVSNPGYRLDVQDSMNIKIDGSNLARIFFNGTSTRISYNDATGHLSFFTNSTERCYVGYNGAFSIISGGLNVSGGNIALSGGDRSIINNDANALIFGTNGTERMRLDSSGRLGLGTSSPSSLLHLSVATAASDGTKGVRISNPAGTTAIFECGSSNDSYVGTTSGSDFSIRTNNTPRVYVTNGGAVGIGTTSPGATLQIVDAGGSGSGTVRIGGATYYGQIQHDTVSTGANIYNSQDSGGHIFQRNGNEQMRLDANSRLLIGTSTSVPVLSSATGAAVQVNSSAFGSYAQTWFYGANNEFAPVIMLAKSRNTTYGSYTVVQNNDQLGGLWFAGDDGTDLNQSGAKIEAFVDGTPGNNDMPGRLVFSTTADGASSPTERMRIRNDGQTYWVADAPTIGTYGTSIGRAGLPGLFETYRNAGATNSVINAGGNAGQVVVYGDGDLENTNNRYTGFSDIRLKQNIEDSGSQWDDIKNVRVRKYELISDPSRRQIGVIAQELELTSPGLVVERGDDTTGEKHKSVAYSVLYMKAVKALQEAMERIEALEAKVAALEGV